MTNLQPFFPTTQIVFSERLAELEIRMLAPALRDVVSRADIGGLDRTFSEMLSPANLNRIASFGIRSEVFYPAPMILEANPYLLGYYRLLYGLSQKEFYRGPYGQFKSMESQGKIGKLAAPRMRELCLALQETAGLLLAKLSQPTSAVVRDLQLLTLGPQLRGSRLNEIGADAERVVFARIRGAIADSAVVTDTRGVIVIKNASGRRVRVQFSSDPDIAIIEELASAERPLLAVEVKGGRDVSNVHNRIGEAEKSHLKAQAKGYTEFWTIVQASVDFAVARSESPTTTRFFTLAGIADPANPEWADFRDHLTARLGVPAAP